MKKIYLFPLFLMVAISLFARPSLVHNSLVCERKTSKTLVSDIYSDTIPIIPNQAKISSLDDMENPLVVYEEYNRIKKARYAAEPTDENNKSDLAISYEKLGYKHMLIGNLDKALFFFEEDNKLCKEFNAANPRNVSFKNTLATSYQ
jgi:hypothetical protein